MLQPETGTSLLRLVLRKPEEFSNNFGEKDDIVDQHGNSGMERREQI